MTKKKKSMCINYTNIGTIITTAEICPICEEKPLLTDMEKHEEMCRACATAPEV